MYIHVNCFVIVYEIFIYYYACEYLCVLYICFYPKYYLDVYLADIIIMSLTSDDAQLFQTVLTKIATL